MVTWLKNLRNLYIFSFQFKKIITRYRRIEYNLNVMRLSACLDFNPIMVDNYSCMLPSLIALIGSGVRLYDCPYLYLFISVGRDRCFLSVAWPTWVQLVFSFAPELVSYFAPRSLHRRAAYLICKSPFLINHGGYHDLFVCP